MNNSYMDTNALSDADMESLSGYLSGELSVADANAIEQRLTDDEQFYDSAAPYIKLWRSDVWHEQKRMVPRHGVLLAAAAAVLMVFLPGKMFGKAVQEIRWLAGSPGPQLGDVATGHGETRVVTLPGGSTVRLAPMSRLSYRRAASLWPGYVVTLQGTGVFDVTRADRPLYVATMRGEATLFTGRYGVRCDIGCATMLVTTARGVALLNDGVPLDWRWVGAGGFGAVGPGVNHLIARTAGGPDYPVVTP